MKLRYRECPLCRNKPYFTTGLPNGIREGIDKIKPVKCSKCSLVYLNPIMSNDNYKDFYNKDSQKKFVDSLLLEKYQEKINKDDYNRARFINKYFDSNHRVLDIGTGYSNFVSLVNGATGIDISEPRVKSAQKRGLNVKLCSIFDWDDNDKVDIITLFHVLEHIPEPRPFLNKIYKILNKDGYLVIEVPNLNDILVNLKKYKEFYFQNAHCSYFTPDKLEELLSLEMFSVDKKIKLQRYSLNNHVHWLIKGAPGKFSVLDPLNNIYTTMLKLIKKHDTIFFICSKRQ